MAWTGLVIAGYLVPLTWTGFRGETLWQWFVLLVAQAAVATTMALTSMRVRGSKVRLRPSQKALIAALTAGWIVTVIGGYALGWNGPAMPETLSGTGSGCSCRSCSRSSCSRHCSTGSRAMPPGAPARHTRRPWPGQLRLRAEHRRKDTQPGKTRRRCRSAHNEADIACGGTTEPSPSVTMHQGPGVSQVSGGRDPRAGRRRPRRQPLHAVPGGAQASRGRHRRTGRAGRLISGPGRIPAAQPFPLFFLRLPRE